MGPTLGGAVAAAIVFLLILVLLAAFILFWRRKRKTIAYNGLPNVHGEESKNIMIVFVNMQFPRESDSYLFTH